MNVKIKLGTKINLIVIAVIVVLSLVIGIVVNHEITEGIKEFATEKAKGDLRLAYRYIETKYPGEWVVKDNTLYKGTTVINDNYEVVDKIGEDTGDTVTIFLGDTRIATNVMKNGERAIRTKASPEVLNMVLKKGENFYGEADVEGNKFQAAYMPLESSSGEIIGMIYAGAPQKMISNILTSLFTKFLVALILVIGLASAAVYWFTWKMKKRLTKLTNVLELAGNGDFTTNVNDNSSDELGSLSRSYNDMSESLKKMMHEVILTSEQLASSSEQLTASSEQTSIATETITESIQRKPELKQRIYTSSTS